MISEARPFPMEGAASRSAPDRAEVARAIEQQTQQRGFSRNTMERLAAALSPILLLVVWELTSRSGLLDTRFFPPPTVVATAFTESVGNGSLFAHTMATLYRVAMGLLIGCGIGVLVGLFLGIVRLARMASLPILSVTMPIPKIALLPLFMLLLGLGDGSKIAVVAISVFFIMVYNTMAGVVSIPRIYLDVGRSFEVSRLNFYRTIALPGALPMMLTGFKLSFAVGLLVIVPAEWTGSRLGLGAMVYQAWNTFNIAELYVGIVTLGLLGYLSGLILEEVERLLVPWRL
jgi:NitT/TauT family transport system permease protein